METVGTGTVKSPICIAWTRRYNYYPQHFTYVATNTKKEALLIYNFQKILSWNRSALHKTWNEVVDTGPMGEFPGTCLRRADKAC